MSHPDAEKWNGRYQTEGRGRQQSPPRELLRAYHQLLPKNGWALDAASGVGINSFYLAQLGLNVLALDISEVGLRLVREKAIEEGFQVNTAVFDLSNPHLPADTFDVIINFRFLERATFAAYRNALKVGGVLIFETFVYEGVPDEPHPYFLLPGELNSAFQDWDVVHSAETAVEGSRSHQMKKVAQLVARKV